MPGNNTNWAGNLTYSTERAHAPQSIGEVQDVVRRAKKAHAVGSRHSFTPIADTDCEQISLRHLNKVLAIDAAAGTVTVEGGITYGELAPQLHVAGFALHNLASLPTITVAGAAATATHGSGNNSKNLSAAVRGVKIVTANGEIAEFNRGDAAFDGVVVALGALGVVTELTLDIQPSFDIRQDEYVDLLFETAVANFDEIMGSGYSVSLLHAWTGNAIGKVLVKRLADAPPQTGDFFGAKAGALSGKVNGFTTLAGAPWHLRLPHFQADEIALAGEELQAEYFVARHHAAAALRAIQQVQHRLEKVLIVGELRTVAADTMWLSPAFERDCLAIHFTCRSDWPGLMAALPAIEAALAPFDPRPHWAKAFTMTAAQVQKCYPKLAEFRAFRRQIDPHGKFANPFIDEFIG